MRDLSYSRLVIHHVPTLSTLYERGKQVSSPVCPCGKIETLSHVCFECPLLPPPNPTYSVLIQKHLPPKLKEDSKKISHLLSEFVADNGTNEEGRLKILQGVMNEDLTLRLIHQIQIEIPNKKASYTPNKLILCNAIKYF